LLPAAGGSLRGCAAPSKRRAKSLGYVLQAVPCDAEAAVLKEAAASVVKESRCTSHNARIIRPRIGAGQFQRKHPVRAVCRSGCSRCLVSLPVTAVPIPWQQFVEPLRGMLGDAGEHVGEPGQRIDVIELCRHDQCSHDGRALGAAL
jgi:hypothetical protein